jgi:hypothetical protein
MVRFLPDTRTRPSPSGFDPAPVLVQLEGEAGVEDLDWVGRLAVLAVVGGEVEATSEHHGWLGLAVRVGGDGDPPEPPVTAAASQVARVGESGHTLVGDGGHVGQPDSPARNGDDDNPGGTGADIDDGRVDERLQLRGHVLVVFFDDPRLAAPPRPAITSFEATERIGGHQTPTTEAGTGVAV